MDQIDDTGPVSGAVAQKKPPSVLEEFGSGAARAAQGLAHEITRGAGVEPTASPPPAEQPPSVTERVGEFVGGTAPWLVPSLLKAARPIPVVGPVLGAAGTVLGAAAPAVMALQGRGNIKDRQDMEREAAVARGETPPAPSVADEIKADVGGLASAALQHFGIGKVGGAIEGVLPAVTSRAGQAAAAAVSGAAGLGFGSAGATAVERAAAGQPVTSPEGLREIGESGVTGAIGGGVIGGVAGALHPVVPRETKPAGPITAALQRIQNPAQAHVESAALVGEPPLAKANMEAQAEQEPAPRYAADVTDNAGNVTGYKSKSGVEIAAGRDLNDEQRGVEQRAVEQVAADPEKTLQSYRDLPGSNGGRFISTDVARNLFPEYVADEASRSTHAVSVEGPARYVADQAFARAIEEPVQPGKQPVVTFTAGGTGAGKSTALQIPGIKRVASLSDIVVDDNGLQNLKSAQARITAALDSGRSVNIINVERDPIDAFKNGVLSRAATDINARTVPIDQHVETHIGTAETIAKLKQLYKGDDRVNIVTIDNGKLSDNAIDRTGLRNDLLGALKQERDNGKVPDRVWQFYQDQARPDSGGTQPAAAGAPRPQEGGAAAGRSGNIPFGQTEGAVPAFSKPASESEGLPDGGRLRGGAGVLAPQDEVKPLVGLPRRVRVDGTVEQFGPHATAVKAAEEYARQAGLPYVRPTTYAKIDESRAKRIADEFEKMQHAPDDPHVKRAYKAMVDETLAQWEAIKKTGLKVEFIKDGQKDPYGTNPRKAIQDVTENNHLWVFPTDQGFGSAGDDVRGNPLLESTGEVVDGRKVVANDIFRIVHDYFGHIKEGVGFRAEGEENAWRSHSAMYSEEARKAMTTETRGQNSWVNFGPHAEHNKTANGAETKYATQKIGLLPDWVVNEGARDEAPQGTASEQTAFSRPDAAGNRRERGVDRGQSGKGWHERPVHPQAVATDAVHYSTTPGLRSLDGSKYGSNHAGAERGRLADKGGITNRVYFYPSDSPLAQRGEPYVGRGAKYRQTLSNIYDARTDPLDLRDKADRLAARTGMPLGNAFEQLVVRSGFDGYRTHEMAVVLGAKAVKVAAEEPVAKSEPTRPGAHTIDTLAHELASSSLGRALSKLEGKARIEIVNEPDNVFAGKWENGRATLNAAWINKGEALGVALHELGVHGARLGDILTPAGIARYNARLDAMTGADAELVRLADERIPADTSPGLRAEERIAYFIEEATNTHGAAGDLASRIVASLKAAVLDSPFGKALERRGLQLTAKDMVELARAAVTKAGGGKGAMFSLPRGTVDQEVTDSLNMTPRRGDKRFNKDIASHRFLNELYDRTAENPFNPRERVMHDGKGNWLGAIEMSPRLGGRDNTVHLSSIRSFEKGIGQGTAMMNQLKSLADKHNVSMDLIASKFGKTGLSTKQLDKWYRKHGFDGKNNGYLTRQPAKLSVPKRSDDTFFSAMDRSLTRAAGAPKKGGEALKQWLDGAQRRGEFKGSERQWLGVDAWLSDHPNATREELAQFVRSNQVEIKPVKLQNEELTLDERNELKYLRALADRRGGFDNAGDEARFDELSALAERGSATRYGEHTLPGGENYREHLLTLPKIEDVPENTFRVEQRPDGNWHVLNDRGAIQKAFRTKEDADHYADIYGPRRSVAQEQFRSSHFDEPNILAHVRMNDRTTADGAKALHIEEIQSDWHQKGRKEGYAQPEEYQRKQAELSKAVADMHEAMNRAAEEAPELNEFDGYGPFAAAVRLRAIKQPIVDKMLKSTWRDVADAVDRVDELQKASESARHGVPNAPLKNTEDWAMLGFKHALREAVETGKDKVTWTTGEQQNERYDLSKQIHQLNVFKRPDGSYDLSAKTKAFGRRHDIGERIPESKLQDYVGKDMAEKIVRGEGTPDESAGKWRTFSGLDLKVGGEGMRGFYDKILPKAVEKYVKQWGGKVGESEIGGIFNGGAAHTRNPVYAIFDRNGNDTGESVAGYREASAAADRIGGSIKPRERTEKVHSVDITPAMRESVKEGQPLFSKPREPKEILGARAKYLKSEEFAKLRRDTAEKFVSKFDELPSAKEMSHVALAGQAKRGWYRDSAKALVDTFGADSPRFSALLAALSPQCSVETNLTNALHTWKNWLKAGRPTDDYSIRAILGRSVQGDRGEKSVLGAWINNSIRALSADDPSSIQLSGPKVSSFMHNLRGVTDEVTNDAWMARYALVDQTMFKGGLTKGGDPGKGPGYLAMSARIRQAAEYASKLTGVKWTPAEIQETIWSWSKAAFELAYGNKTGKIGTGTSVYDHVKSGDINDDLIRSTPAFGELFNESKYKAILEEAGYQLGRGDHAAVGSEVTGAGGKAKAVTPSTAELLRAARRLDRSAESPAEEIPFSRPRSAARAIAAADLKNRELVRNAARGAWAERDRAIAEADASIDQFRAYFDKRAASVRGDPLQSYASVIAYQRGQPINNPTEEAFLQTMEKLFERQAQEIRRYGEDKLGLLDNYVPQIWKDAGRSPPGDTQAYTGPARKPLGGRTGFRKERVFGDYEEGIAAGLKPEFDNPADAIMARFQAGERYLSALAIRADIERMGLLRKVGNEERVPEGYARVADSTFAGHVVPELVARDLNNYLAPGLSQFAPWRGFRWMQNVLLSARLGFSAFHAGFTTVDSAITHLDLGMRYALAGDIPAAIKHLAQTPLTIGRGAALLGKGVLGTIADLAGIDHKFDSKLVRQFYGKETINDANTAAVLHALTQGGARARMDPTDWNNDLTKVLRAWRQDGVTGLAKTPMHLLGATLEAVMRPIAHYLVPAQKMTARVELMKYELDRVAGKLGTQRGDYAATVKALDQDAMRQIAYSVVQRVDDRLGQMAYDNLFWNRTIKDLLQASIQSVGWNFGTYNVVFKGLKDVEKIFKPEQLLAPLDAAGTITNHQMSRITGRLSYLIALNLGIGTIGAITQYLRTGQGPQELKDYFFPKTGEKNLDGTDARSAMPSYVKDEFGFVSHPIQTATHKLHPSFSMIAELLSNKNFYGDHIYNIDDGWEKVAEQIAKYVTKGFLPYAVQNKQQIEKQGGGAIEQTLPFFGITPAPGDITHSRFQNYVRDTFREDHPHDAKSPQEAERSQKWFDAVSAIKRGEPVDPELTPKEKASAIKYAKSDPIANHFARLSIQQQFSAWDKATPEERKQYNLRGLIFKGIARKLPSIVDPDERKAIMAKVSEIRASN